MSLLAPFLVQIFLTFIVAVLLFMSRVRAVTSRQVRVRDILVSNSTWPERSKLIGNNFANQFETPVLFYALVLMAMQVGATGTGVVACAWIYVVSRLVHAFIHLTSNRLNPRFGAFLVGVGALLAMAVQLALKVMA